MESAKEALKLNNYRETTWVNPLTVISKTEWMQRKKDFKSVSSSQQPAKSNPTSTPYLLVSPLEGSESSKDLWRLFSAMGPIRHLEVFRGQQPTPFVNPHSCVVQYESSIVCE